MKINSSKKTLCKLVCLKKRDYICNEINNQNNSKWEKY